MQHVFEPVGRVLGVPLESRKVDIDDAELGCVTRQPLEVVKKRPGKVGDHVRAIIDRFFELAEVVLIELDPYGVVQELFTSEISRLIHSVF